VKRGKADKARCMNLAEGSIEESRYQLILSEDLGYRIMGELVELLNEVGRLRTTIPERFWIRTSDFVLLTPCFWLLSCGFCLCDLWMHHAYRR
jgi:23S rRNA-intervening sequence protein